MTDIEQDIIDSARILAGPHGEPLEIVANALYTSFETIRHINSELANVKAALKAAEAGIKTSTHDRPVICLEPDCPEMAIPGACWCNRHLDADHRRTKP